MWIRQSLNFSNGCGNCNLLDSAVCLFKSQHIFIYFSERCVDPVAKVSLSWKASQPACPLLLLASGSDWRKQHFTAGETIPRVLSNGTLMDQPHSRCSWCSRKQNTLGKLRNLPWFAEFIAGLLCDKTEMAKTPSCCRCCFAGALQGPSQGQELQYSPNCWVCVSGEERASSGISIVTPLVFGRLLLLASTFISVFLTWLLVLGFMPCWWAVQKNCVPGSFYSHSYWKWVLMHSSPSENLISSYTWWIHNNFFSHLRVRTCFNELIFKLISP